MAKFILVIYKENAGVKPLQSTSLILHISAPFSAGGLHPCIARFLDYGNANIKKFFPVQQKIPIEKIYRYHK